MTRQPEPPEPGARVGSRELSGDRIVLSAIRVWGRHGVHDREREEPQPFEVDVELELDLSAAGRTDDLASTVDYAAVEALVRELVRTRRYRLLEALAAAIADEVTAACPLRAAVVRVRKLRAPLSGPVGSVGVQIRRPTPDDMPAPRRPDNGNS